MSKATVDDIEPMLRHHTIVVEDTDLVAWADPTSMNRILTNLLRNAAKYSPPGSTITIHFDSAADRVRLSVTDQGRGIAPEDIETIFDELNRGRLAENDGGTGLGLASVRRLTSLQGGRAWIESELGHGTTATVELLHSSEAAGQLTPAR